MNGLVRVRCTGWRGLRVGRNAQALVALLVGLWAGQVQAECLAFRTDIARIWSDKVLEDRVAAYLRANARRFGGIDWDCLEHAFTVLSRTTSVRSVRGGGVQGGDVYRFTVDRSRNPLALAAAPGSGGVFTAVVRVTAAGRVAVMRSGGEAEWVN